MFSDFALFFGTFNPLHIGHLMIADSAQRQFDFPKIKFMLSPFPPHKDSLEDRQERLPFIERAEIIKASILDNNAFELDLREGERNGLSYTVDTVLEIKQEYKIQKRLPLIIGADSFLSIESWNRYMELIEHCEFLVAGREVLVDSVNLTDSFSFKSIEKLSWQPINMSLLSISSTQIRDLKRNKEAYQYLMHSGGYQVYK